ncbi:Methyltransferase type 11 [Plesiocystis pacifica SIR-1]|uniref:Methyltransferase type 11 n=1 Tax=Plesiocystis pacifica SIR-1 TaxID=391625 RepID=A6FWV0_9BACT|nr:class I SAM-dependent methyltransferase [Plesiocystis pacifica]EDM81774.1 Methyltransferase type 11 [Plesiocystis pacifica SIR-1]
MRARLTTALTGALGLLLLLSACPSNDKTQPPAAHYGDKQAALASFEEPERDAWARPAQVVEALKLEPGADVADIGAGSGYFTRRLAQAASGGTTYAVDVDADFKRHIDGQRARWGTPNIVTRLAVYEHPLLPANSVDVVFISNTYSFLQDRAAYFRAVHSALRPGGRLALIDWRAEVQCPRHVGCPKPNQRIPKAMAKRELAGVGFAVAEEHDFLPYQYFLILTREQDAGRRKPAVRPPSRTTPSRPTQPSATPRDVKSPR